MGLKTADAIRRDWAKFLEITHGNLMMIFLTKIPQGLLPYPKQQIKEALEIISKHFASRENEEAVKVIASTFPFLDFYIEDEEALIFASKNFANKKNLEVITSELSKNQKILLENLLKNNL